MPTERLYYSDSHLIEFEALVTDKSERVSGWTAVTLDRTAFYPTGGGQPSDTGTLNGAHVVECIDDERSGVWHVIHGNVPAVGSTVKGRVDWARRLDHIQQHTGQHILSQSLVTLFKAPTRSFRVLDHSCEIDVELSNPTTEMLERAVELANNVIWEDRPIKIMHVTPEQATELPLRRDPVRQGELRLIEIAGFDLTPCGGTHAYRTGEVGIIAMRSWERAKGLIRIEWVAGGRALADYRLANQSARATAALFSGGRDDTPILVEKLIEENKELHRKVRSLEERTIHVEAEELRAQAAGNTNEELVVVTCAFDKRDADSLRRLASALVAHPNTVALLGSHDNDAARVVFARSSDAPGDMNALMREACVALEGKGGGKPDLAQGGGRNAAKLEDVIASTSEAIRKQTSSR
jgi:alanyl-tRNA synthetase